MRSAILESNVQNKDTQLAKFADEISRYDKSIRLQIYFHITKLVSRDPSEFVISKEQLRNDISCEDPELFERALKGLIDMKILKTDGLYIGMTKQS